MDYTRCQAFKSSDIKPNWPEKSFIPSISANLPVKDEMIGGCKNGAFSGRENLGSEKNFLSRRSGSEIFNQLELKNLPGPLISINSKHFHSDLDLLCQTQCEYYEVQRTKQNWHVMSNSILATEYKFGDNNPPGNLYHMVLTKKSCPNSLLVALEENKGVKLELNGQLESITYFRDRSSASTRKGFQPHLSKISKNSKDNG